MKMKTIKLLFLFLLVWPSISYGQKIVLLHTNDMHSKITGFGPEIAYSPMVTGNDSTTGGFARLATLIKQEKKKNPNNVLVCDAGDFLMGTIFQAGETKNGFQLLLMKQMGYDVVTIGNHEFDFGPNKLADIINAGRKRGDLPQIVATQFQFSAESKDDDKLAELVNEKFIKEYDIFERNGLKIGVFGLIGDDAVHVAPAAAPVTFANRIKTAERVTQILRNKEKVDVIICLSHSGFEPTGNNTFSGEDLDLATKVPDIDVIISGHTHVKTPKAINVGKTLIVQTGAYVHNLGRLELNYENGKLKNYDFKLIPINDEILGDSVINEKIEKYKEVIAKEFFTPLGLDYSTPIAEVDYKLNRGNDAKKIVGSVGAFVADAINYYTDKYSTPSDVVLVANGIVRESFYKGEISAADAFRMAPLGSGKSDLPGYSLAQIYVTGHELKKLMELILMSRDPGTNGYLFVSGIEADYNPKKMMLRKVQTVRVDGQVINTSKKDKKLYTITANTYLLSFIGDIKKMSHGLIKIIPKDVNGNFVPNVKEELLDFDKNKEGLQEGKEWIAIIEYLKQFDDKTGNKIPDVPQTYKTVPVRLHAIEK